MHQSPHHIRPLSGLSKAEIKDIARWAADRGEPLDTENPYPSGTDQHNWFADAYHARECELGLATA